MIDITGTNLVDFVKKVVWYIEQSDGIEHVAEKHRTWG